MSLSRAARLTVVGSAWAVLALGAWIGASLQPSLPAIVAAAFIATLLIARGWPRIAPAAVLLPACLHPALIKETAGIYDPVHASIWLGALLGAVIGLTGARDWSLPRIWRFTLAHGALCLALVWPIVAGRELDWTPGFLSED